MNNNLKSSLWKKASEDIRKCHLLSLEDNNSSDVQWNGAFALLVAAILDERKENPDFAKELPDLTQDTGFIYDFEDILEEYFDHLEEMKDWKSVITSCDTIRSLFAWTKVLPSEYNYRKGNALLEAGLIEEAEAFGMDWLKEYPEDYYAAASNVFLQVALGNLDEAEALTKKYLTPELVCNDKTETIFMAAELLFEKTQDSNAKARVAAKIAEYNRIVEEK